MKKVGIITRYYGSCNYGGLLQAYALCRYLRGVGLEAEQICYKAEAHNGGDALAQIKKLSFGAILRKARNMVVNRIKKLLTKVFARKHIACKKKATQAFRQSIPHSEEVFDPQTVKRCNELYDAFITGSDRVWNASRPDGAYFLDFVENKPKYSYAASLMAKELTPQQKRDLTERLGTYAGISVRERETACLLAPLEAQWVVDPTLLLTKEQWDEVAADRLVDEEYLFCYFLGNDRRNRKTAKAFAKKHGLKIVTMPHTEGQFYFSDVAFGDIQLSDVTPGDFISLIKHARCVFTDSFHATVFSAIYEKEVFSFFRKNKANSGTRLESLTALLGTESHLCMTKERFSAEYVQSAPPIDYGAVEQNLKDMLQKSKDFLGRIV